MFFTFLATMIRPSAFKTYIDQLRTDFPEFKTIFIANLDGSLIATNNLNEKLNITCLASMWDDCSTIGKIKCTQEQNKEKSPLEYMMVESKGNFTILIGLNDIFIMGFMMNLHTNLGYALQKIQIIKDKLNE